MNLMVTCENFFEFLKCFKIYIRLDRLEVNEIELFIYKYRVVLVMMLMIYF